jgi:hypothetical protein
MKVHRPTDPRKINYDAVENSPGWPETRSGLDGEPRFACSRRLPGIRNFVVGVTVKVASDESTMRKEKTFVDKLDLTLVQVRFHSLFNFFLQFLLDFETRMAAQLAKLHN